MLKNFVSPNQSSTTQTTCSLSSYTSFENQFEVDSNNIIHLRLHAIQPPEVITSYDDAPYLKLTFKTNDSTLIYVHVATSELWSLCYAMYFKKRAFELTAELTATCSVEKIEIYLSDLIEISFAKLFSSTPLFAFDKLSALLKASDVNPSCFEATSVPVLVNYQPAELPLKRKPIKFSSSIFESKFKGEIIDFTFFDYPTSPRQTYCGFIHLQEREDIKETNAFYLFRNRSILNYALSRIELEDNKKKLTLCGSLISKINFADYSKGSIEKILIIDKAYSVFPEESLEALPF